MGQNVKGPAIRAWGQYHSRVIGSMGDTRAASKAPQRKRPCRSRATARRSLLRHAFQPALKHSRDQSRTSRSHNMTDEELDFLKSRLYRGFGMEVRPDLQVRAEIILQPEDGRWVFTPEELNNLADGLNSILQRSNPGAGWPFRLTLKEYIGLFTPPSSVSAGAFFQ